MTSELLETSKGFFTFPAEFWKRKHRIRNYRLPGNLLLPFITLSLLLPIFLWPSRIGRYKNSNDFCSVADPGCLSRIRIFFRPGSRIQVQKDSQIRSGIKEFKYFNPKKMFLSSRKYRMFRDVHPGSGSWIFYPSRIQGSKRHRILNTGFLRSA